MEYTIVQDMNLDNFVRLVEKALQEGWRPQGGVSLSGIWYLQALVRDLQPEDSRP